MEQNDSFTLTETEDGGLEISWDKNDPNWAWANDLTEEEIKSMLMNAIKESMQEAIENE